MLLETAILRPSRSGQPKSSARRNIEHGSIAGWGCLLDRWDQFANPPVNWKTPSPMMASHPTNRRGTARDVMKPLAESVYQFAPCPVPRDPVPRDPGRDVPCPLRSLPAIPWSLHVLPKGYTKTVAMAVGATLAGMSISKDAVVSSKRSMHSCPKRRWHSAPSMTPRAVTRSRVNPVPSAAAR